MKQQIKQRSNNNKLFKSNKKGRKTSIKGNYNKHNTQHKGKITNKSSKPSKLKQTGGAEGQETILYYFIGFLTITIIIYLFYNNYQLQKAQQDELRAKIANVDKQLSDLSSNVTRHQQSVFAGNDLRDPTVPDRRGGVPINIRTRGEPEQYRNVGYLFINNPATAPPTPTQPPTEITTETNTINLTTNVNVNTSSNNSVLSLYGRRLWNGSDMWNYYVLNENYNQVRLPLTINNKDSMDEYGVKELYDNDTVFLPSQGKTFTVKIYETDEYRYIPY